MPKHMQLNLLYRIIRFAFVPISFLSMLVLLNYSFEF